MKNLAITFATFFLASCNPSIPRESIENNNQYAERFHISDHQSFRILTLKNPWQGEEEVVVQYILCRTGVNLPDSLASHPKIITPVSDVIVFSTTHIGFICALGEANGIKAVSGSKYICDSVLYSAAQRKIIKEIGIPPDINYETVIETDPDLVLLYGLDAGISGISDRFENSGIPSLLIAEYLEPHPLGKMEWIKVFGAVYEKDKMADSLFDAACRRYEHLTSQILSDAAKPAVFTGLPWKDTWYMAGGKSFTAQLIKDAGGYYLWESDQSSQYIPLSMESVLIRSLNADVWINTGTAEKLSEIEARDPRFTRIKAFKTGEVYNNNAQLCESGGNQFWEKGVVEPHIILEDLIKILHPGLMEDDSLVYYRKIK